MYIHYFMHAELPPRFSVRDYPRLTISDQQKTLYNVHEAKKFLLAIAKDSVVGITDLADGMYQNQVVADRFIQFMASGNNMVVDIVELGKLSA